MKLAYKITLPIIGLITLFFIAFFILVTLNFKHYGNTVYTSTEENLLKSYKSELKTATELAVGMMQGIYADTSLTNEASI